MDPSTRERFLDIGPIRQIPSLKHQCRRARDVSAFMLEDGSAQARSRLAHRASAFHRALQRLHALPVGLRRDLLLFDELDTRRIGEEHLVEPIPPDSAISLDSLIQPQSLPRSSAEVIGWLVRLLEILLQLSLHGIPAHLMLRTECIYVTRTGGVLLGDLGLSVLIPDLAHYGEIRPEFQIYAAPEFLGQHVYARGDLADVHALGCIAARLLLPAADFTFLAVRDPRDKYVLPPPEFSAASLRPQIAELLAAATSADPLRRPPLFAFYAELKACEAHPSRFRFDFSAQSAQSVRKFVETVVDAPPATVRAALGELIRPHERVPPDGHLVLTLGPALHQLLNGAPPLQSTELALSVEVLRDMLVAAVESPNIRLLAWLGLIAMGMHHLACLDPFTAAEIFAQVRELSERAPSDAPQLDNLLMAVELEAALGTGRARELTRAHTTASRPLTDETNERLRVLHTATRGMLDLALGNRDAARSALENAVTGTKETPITGLPGHALGRLRLHVELADQPLGLTHGDLEQLRPELRQRLSRLACEERDLRIISQIDCPGSLLFESLASAVRAPRATLAPKDVWRERILAGIWWERRKIQGRAVQHYLFALGLLPMDAAVIHHLDLYAWLASVHIGVSRDFVGTKYLIPASEWRSRLPRAPESVSTPLQEAQRYFAALPKSTQARRPSPSLLEGLDAEVTQSPGRVANWILSRLLDEFDGMYATLTLLNLGSQPLCSRTHPSDSGSSTFEAAIDACGWFNEVPPAVASRQREQLREVLRSDPLHWPFALAMKIPCTLLETVDQLREVLDALGHYIDAKPKISSTTFPLPVEGLVLALNRELVGSPRKFHIISAPIEPGFVHIVFVTPEAFHAASAAGLMYLHFSHEYTASTGTLLYGIVHDQQATPARSQQALAQARYTGDPVEFATDTLVCRAQINRGIKAELKFSAGLYRTYDETDRKNLEVRFAELAPAFMLVADWTSTAPPIPTQLRTLHLMAHEAKRPLLWMQKTLTRMLREDALGSAAYHKIEGLLDVCVSRFALFCGSKVWDPSEFLLKPQIEQLLSDWRIALTASGEGLQLQFVVTPDQQRQLDGMKPLWLRGQALELSLSELLENARKYSRPATTIQILLNVTPQLAGCSIELIIRNHARDNAQQAVTGPMPQRVERFSSTGLGTQLLSDLVRQLDDGRITGSRDANDLSLHITRLAFTAPFAPTRGQLPHEARS